MIFVANCAFAQQFSLKDNANKAFTFKVTVAATALRAKYFPRQLVPANFYSSNLGFFCKKEIRFENTTKIPLRFRLGPVQYCDYLESKPNAIMPAH